jgi:D-alanyl-lipoteichoic acid acyltransferase DltB (MBOAT superfamily)
MIFNSLTFLLFFPIVTIAYYALPQHFRWLWLLSTSCFFYISFIPIYFLILLTTIVVDYYAAIYIENHSGTARRHALILSIVITCLILFIFKYFNFFNINFEHLAHLLNWHYPIQSLQLLLPIGLSFHTFQSLSYVIEVYRKKQKAEKHFGIYALYVMFYPQLVAGPIERPQNLLHQFYEEHQFNIEEIFEAGKRIGWGLFKKIVIADRLAFYVNKAYENPSSFSGLTLTICTVFLQFRFIATFRATVILPLALLEPWGLS